MARWKYELKCGKELREEIHEGNSERILNVLQKAYKELFKAGVIDESDYDLYTDEFIIYDADDLEEADVNYELSEFYDLCDELGVWVSV
jgi:hypothetical protein